MSSAWRRRLPPPPIDALALLLKLVELATRILDLVVHVEAFRAPHQPAAEDEEALSKQPASSMAALRALEHAIGLGNLLSMPRSARFAPPPP